MVKCNDCKHFDNKMVGGFGSCELMGSSEGNPHEKHTIAYALDFDDYSAWVRVKPDFGCVQGESKEDVSDGQL